MQQAWEAQPDSPELLVLPELLDPQDIQEQLVLREPSDQLVQLEEQVS